MSDVPKLSAYVSAFNLIQNGFDYQSSLRAMVGFFDEVVVAVNTSTDNTLKVLQDMGDYEQGGLYIGPKLGWEGLRIISTSFSYTDITFDGAIKNSALQACTQNDPNRVYVQMDLDEVVPLSQRALWRTYAAQLLSNPNVQCFMFPSVDLYGSMDTVRADKHFGLKWRMHKGGLYRGVWKEAWVNGRRNIDTSRSDSCELTDKKGDLVTSMSVVPPQYLHPAMSHILNQYPFSLHLGYVNFDQRVRVNKAIWADHWTLRSGHKENVAVDKMELDSYPKLHHSLKLT